MEIPLLQDIVILLGLSVVVIFLFQKLKLPTILGFLATGIAFGPYGFGLIQASHDIEILSEIGVILLLFIIGLEFSLASLAKIKKVVFIGGASQVLLTIGAVVAATMALGFGLNESLFIGFLVSLSSTAIVLSLLQSSGMMNSPHGKIALGILIFQDIIVVPMMLLTPMLAGEGGNIWVELGLLIAKAVAVIVAVLISARYLVPKLLQAIVKTRSRELFIISIVVICFAVAWITSSIGLSLALGAFMAGLTISESEYSHQATGLIIPFREIFASFFFVSIGMLLDISFFVEHIGFVLLITLAVFVLKFTIIVFSSAILGFPARTSLLSGFTLFQVGEFAFILAAVGVSYNLLTDEPYQYFLAVSVLTMALTPFVMQASDKLSTALVNKSRFKHVKMNGANAGMEEVSEELKDHLIIIGYGLNGRHLAEIARNAEIPYAIIDINTDNVELGKSKGEPIFFGDASNPYMLEHLHVYKARVAVVAISDPPATRKVVSSIRSICNTVHVIARTRFFGETNEYLKLGASEVISEEFETSVEIFTRVLHQYLVPEADITNYVQGVRKENYEMLRPFFNGNANLGLPDWQDLKVISIRVETSNEEIVGVPLSEAKLRNKYGISVMAIYRNDEVQKVVDPSAHLEKGDLVYVFGSPEAIGEFGKAVKG
ncbi:cation:proton antiporter [Owenweeksia hongkongensis]|uniref:cation:proton antiporter domain-containing protein n=1 Tax=Owenweeksia hongkongensis TaxID=253245 RepID=UPI003A8D4F13